MFVLGGNFGPSNWTDADHGRRSDQGQTPPKGEVAHGVNHGKGERGGDPPVSACVDLRTTVLRTLTI